MSNIIAYSKFKGEAIEIPDHIVERTENLLSEHPLTNQRIILDTAQWWLENVGNCPIYRWAIHYLDHLEHDTLESLDVYTDAREQAEDIGLDV